MEEKKPHRFYLKWPWNVVVYVLLAIVLRLFAIPVILLLMWWNKKQQPDGPEEGYCLQRTRNRLSRLVLALLALLFAGLMGFLFVGSLIWEQPMEAWDMEDFGIWIFSGVACLVCVALGGVIGYGAIRDAFFPEKSRLAQSIRAQLPYPDEAPPVRELFAMVDEDIRENGQWFDRVAVGKTWVLGDDVTAIDRIRAVFGRDEIVRRHSNGTTRVSRITELYIIDDRHQTQVTNLRNFRELEPLLDCLRLRAPEALFLPYEKYMDYQDKPEEEWQALERGYQRRRNQRGEEREEQRQQSAQNSDDFVFTGLDGQRTSRVNVALVNEQMRLLTEADDGSHLSLELLEPVPLERWGSLVRLEVGVTNAGLTLIAVLRQGDGSYLGYGLPADLNGAMNACRALLEKKQAPDLSGWQPLQAVQQAPEAQRPDTKLILRDAGGIERTYTSFSRRDVELAGEGIIDGRYQAVILAIGTSYIQLVAGDKEDGRVTVRTVDPQPGTSRFYERKCSDREARQMLLDFVAGRFAPSFKEWKDITKAVQARRKQAQSTR